jgi:uncharacterized protein YpmB
MTKRNIAFIIIIAFALFFFAISQGGATFLAKKYYMLRYADGRNQAIENIRKQYPGMTVVDVTTATGNPVFSWSILFTHDNHCYRIWYSSDGAKQADGPVEVPNECRKN